MCTHLTHLQMHPGSFSKVETKAFTKMPINARCRWGGGGRQERSHLFPTREALREASSLKGPAGTTGTWKEASITLQSFPARKMPSRCWMLMLDALTEMSCWSLLIFLIYNSLFLYLSVIDYAINYNGIYHVIKISGCSSFFLPLSLLTIWHN